METPPAPIGYRPFLSGMRSPVVAPLTRFAIGIPLVLLTTETARFFAWTIEPPMTAGFLGANYWASALLAVLAAQETLWANGRVSVSVALAFAPLTTLATLLHLDQFHLDTFFGWFWVVAYTIYPIQLAIFLRRQLLVPGGDPPKMRPLPMWVRAVLPVHAAVLIPLGIALFVAPGSVASLWPWPIPPLSAQVIAAWLLAFGVLAGHSFLENEWARVRAGMLGYGFLGLMQVIMLVRFGDVIDLEEPSAVVYLVVVVSFFVLGAYGLVAESRSRPGAAAKRRFARRPTTTPSTPPPPP
jgi:hypothetical protein